MNGKPLGGDAWPAGEYRGFVPRPRFPVRAWRTIRYRYPYTAGAVLYVAASVAMLFFGPSRKLGALLLAILVLPAATVTARELARRRRQ